METIISDLIVEAEKKQFYENKLKLEKEIINLNESISESRESIIE